MATKKAAKDSAQTEKAASNEATGVRTKITDLSLGDIVVITGFDGPRTICDANKIKDGPDADKFDLALRNEAGEVEHARFAPDEEVEVVGKAPKGGKDGAVPAASAARKTGAKGKSKATKTEGAKATKPEGAKKAKKEKAPKPPKEKKTSALDAAAKVLAEAGKPMSTQETIDAMSAAKYWTSPTA
jgi:hypothetical protein